MTKKKQKKGRKLKQRQSDLLGFLEDIVSRIQLASSVLNDWIYFWIITENLHRHTVVIIASIIVARLLTIIAAITTGAVPLFCLWSESAGEFLNSLFLEAVLFTLIEIATVVFGKRYAVMFKCHVLQVLYSDCMIVFLGASGYTFTQ